MGSAAQLDTIAPYRKFPTVPPLQLTQPDQQLLTKDKLKKNQPVLIMFFSPECDHCQRQLTDLLARMKDLSQHQIILASHEEVKKLSDFSNRYQLSKYPNILIGRDTKFLLPPFYRIRNFPYLALYNKSGDLITTFEGNVTVDNLLKAYNDDRSVKRPRLRQ